MAEVFTLAQVRNKIERDLDLQQEEFVDTVEFTGYVNESIDDAESLIHSLYQDYYLSKDILTLVAGVQEYDLPSDIYGQKLRSVLYSEGNDNNTRRYEVRRLKKFTRTLTVGTEDEILIYVITHKSPNVYKMEFISDVTSTQAGPNITRWYIRNANRVVLETDIIDIPEFKNFIFAHIKWNVARKESLGLSIANAEKHLMKMQRLMEDDLQSRIPDEQNEVEKDFRSYFDQDQHSELFNF